VFSQFDALSAFPVEARTSISMGKSVGGPQKRYGLAKGGSKENNYIFAGIKPDHFTPITIPVYSAKLIVWPLYQLLKLCN
jgi:hypothetical protein